MLRNYAKRVVSVRYNSTKSSIAAADIDSLLERVKNLTKDVKPASKFGGNKSTEGSFTKRRQFNNDNRNRERGPRNNNRNNNEGYNNRSRPQREARFERRDESTPVLEAGINATQNVRSKKATLSNFDSSIGDLLVNEGFDAAAPTTSTTPTRTPTSSFNKFKKMEDLTDAQKAEIFDSQRKASYSRESQGNNNNNQRERRPSSYRGDRPPRRDYGGDRPQGSRTAPGLQNRSRNPRNPRGSNNNSRTRSNNSAWSKAQPRKPLTNNNAYLVKEYKVNIPTAESLLKTSPLLSNDPTSRVVRALRKSLKDPEADFVGDVRGELKLVDVKPFAKQLKTEGMKSNASIVQNALNSTSSLDYKTKLQILGPLIGVAPVKSLPLKFKELEQ